MGNYSSSDNPLLFFYSTEIEPDPDIDLWIAFRVHLDYLAAEPLYKCEVEEKRNFIFEWRNCHKELILDITFVIYTENSSRSKFLRSDIRGMNSKDFIIM